MSDDNRYSNHFVNESPGGDKGALSDDQDIRRKYREHMRKIQGLPSQEPDPTPYPIAFTPLEPKDFTVERFQQRLYGYYQAQLASGGKSKEFSERVVAAHNQSLQTAVVEALEGLVSAYDKKYQKIGAEHGVVRETPHTVFHELIEEAITKAKEVNNV